MSPEANSYESEYDDEEYDEEESDEIDGADQGQDNARAAVASVRSKQQSSSSRHPSQKQN